jgi:hypothetical protein
MHQSGRSVRHTPRWSRDNRRGFAEVFQITAIIGDKRGFCPERSIANFAEARKALGALGPA